MQTLAVAMLVRDFRAGYSAVQFRLQPHAGFFRGVERSQLLTAFPVNY